MAAVVGGMEGMFRAVSTGEKKYVGVVGEVGGVGWGVVWDLQGTTALL